MDIATATYDELKAARDGINQRLKEIERSTIQELELRAQQFGFGLVKNGAPQPPSKPRVKYRDSNGNTWTGKGRKPAWLAQALDEGRQLEEFAI